MDLGVLDEDGFLALMLKLQGTGYAKDPDSVRVGELSAIAKVAALASAALNDAFANLFLQSVNSALDLYERTLYLVQGSALTVDERRARLLAFRQGSWLVEARLDYAFGNYLNNTTGTTQRPTETEARAQGASPGAGLLVSRREPALLTKQQRRDLSTVLERGLPARALSGGVSQRDAVWFDAITPAAIAITPAVSVPPQTKARVAPLTFPPGCSVTRDQWIEVQSTLCWKSHGFSINQHSQGRTVFIKTTIAGGASYVDSSIDWSTRFVQLWGVIGASGSADDPSQLTDVARCWLPPSKTGPAGSGYVHVILNKVGPPGVTGSTGLTLRVDASGRLTIANTGVTLDVRLMVRSSPKYVTGSTTDTQPWINAEQPARDDVADLYQAQVISDTAAGQFAGVSAGAVRRVVYSGPLVQQPDLGIPQSVILDSSEDWRNRWVLVCDVGYDTGLGPTPLPGTIIAAANTFGMFSIPSPLLPSVNQAAPILFYTGPGATSGTPIAAAYQQPLHSWGAGGFPPDIWIFADTDGNLCCEMKANLSYHYSASMMAMIVATERDDGSSVVTSVPVHATQVQTIDLEQPQHCGSFQQGRQGNVPRYLLTDPAPRAIPTCPPLGVISDGNSPVRPVSWMIRERLGARDDGKYEARQSLYSQRRRIVSIKAPAGLKTPVDDFNLPNQAFPAGTNDQMDFRDRLLWVEGRISTTDIRVGAVSPQSDVSAANVLAVMFTGPSNNTSSAIAGSARYSVQLISATSGIWISFEFSRGNPGQGFHSRLVIENNSASDYFLNLVIETSGFLGLADRRVAGQAI